VLLWPPVARLHLRGGGGLAFWHNVSFARPGDRNPQGGHTRRLTLAAVPAAVLAAQSEASDTARRLVEERRQVSDDWVAVPRGLHLLRPNSRVL
jgi:hypothetical protein